MTMLTVKCMQATSSSILKEGENYYAFPINENMTAAYISKFPRKSSHTGCYQLSRFVETDEEVLWELPVLKEPRREPKADNASEKQNVIVNKPKEVVEVATPTVEIEAFPPEESVDANPESPVVAEIKEEIQQPVCKSSNVKVESQTSFFDWEQLTIFDILE